MPNNSFIVGGIFLLGLILRLSLLDTYGLWGDEVVSIEVARAGLPFIFDSRFGWVRNQTIGHYLLIWSTIQHIDAAATSTLVRFPSAVAGALLVLPTFGLGRLLFNRAAGLLAAVSVALSTILLDYSHDLRPYSLLAFFTVVSVYCLVMAERTGSARWWTGFVAATIFNLLNSYTALILALPALASYFVLALWSAYRQRHQRGSSPLMYAVISLTILSAFAFLSLLDMLSTRRSSPDLDGFTIGSVVNVTIAMLSSFMNIGLSGQLGSAISLALTLIALLGAYTGIRFGHGRGVFLCASVCVITSLLLTLLATTSIISPRYVLFAAPFYFLLLGYGITAIAELRQIAVTRPANETAGATATNSRDRTLPRAIELVMVGLLFALLGTGIYNYSNPTGHSALSYKPDFRGVAAYLSREAKAQDIIVLVDDPPLGYNVINFYLHDRPPAPMFDVRDPLLYAQPLRGSIYWVFSSLDSTLTSQVANDGVGWSAVTWFEGVVVLKGDSPAANMPDAVDHIAARLENTHPDFQPVKIIRGTILQALGDVEGAAQAYRLAGMYFPLGNEYLDAAQGFARHGLQAEAWLQGLVAKSMEPYRPEIHFWLEEQLRATGYLDQSRIESRLAEVLSNR